MANKKQKAAIERRIRDWYERGFHGVSFDGHSSSRSADFAAFVMGERRRLTVPHFPNFILDPAGAKLIRKLIRWHDATTRIGWCHFTWNLWVGCVKVSSGCKNCYAEGWAKRTGRKVWGRKADRPITKGWRAKLRAWKRMAGDPMWRHEFGLADGERPRIFIGSLMDWAESRDDLQRLAVARAFEMIKASPWADFLMLTKRPQNIPGLLPVDWEEGYPNVWLMTSVESGDPSVKDAELQAPVIERVRHLLKVPAAVHGVSYEPAIGPLAEALRPFMWPTRWHWDRGTIEEPNGTPEEAIAAGAFAERRRLPAEVVEILERRYLRLIIYGGESGAGWRPEGTPEDPKLWAREMRDACRETGTAYFHKQGAGPRNETGVELDGEIIHEYPTPRTIT